MEGDKLKEQPNYYALIPAPVRYDKDIIPNAKLLYGELTALSNQKGYCWATNRHFADLYSTSEKTITRWVKSLETKGYIKSEVNTFRYDDGTVKKMRKIYIDNYVPYQADIYGNSHTDKNVLDHMDKNVPYNNTTINNKIINKHIYGEFQNVLLTEEEYEKVKNRGLLDILEELSSYIEQIGKKAADKKYSSHYATILNWSRRKKQEQAERNTKKGQLKREPNFDINELYQKAIQNNEYDI